VVKSILVLLNIKVVMIFKKVLIIFHLQSIVILDELNFWIIETDLTVSVFDPTIYLN